MIVSFANLEVDQMYGTAADYFSASTVSESMSTRSRMLGFRQTSQFGLRESPTILHPARDFLGAVGQLMCDPLIPLLVNGSTHVIEPSTTNSTVQYAHSYGNQHGLIQFSHVTPVAIGLPLGVLTFIKLLQTTGIPIDQLQDFSRYLRTFIEPNGSAILLQNMFGRGYVDTAFGKFSNSNYRGVAIHSCILSQDISVVTELAKHLAGSSYVVRGSTVYFILPYLATYKQADGLDAHLHLTTWIKGQAPKTPIYQHKRLKSAFTKQISGEDYFAMPLQLGVVSVRRVTLLEALATFEGSGFLSQILHTSLGNEVLLKLKSVYRHHANEISQMTGPALSRLICDAVDQLRSTPHIYPVYSLVPQDKVRIFQAVLDQATFARSRGDAPIFRLITQLLQNPDLVEVAKKPPGFTLNAEIRITSPIAFDVPFKKANITLRADTAKLKDDQISLDEAFSRPDSTATGRQLIFSNSWPLSNIQRHILKP